MKSLSYFNIKSCCIVSIEITDICIESDVSNDINTTILKFFSFFFCNLLLINYCTLTLKHHHPPSLL